MFQWADRGLQSLSMRMVATVLALGAAFGNTPAHADNISGDWLSPTANNWPVIAIHAALTPDGRVLTYGTTGTGKQTGYFVYDVWDPQQGLTAGHMTLNNLTQTDIFCSSQIVLPQSGSIFIAGGDNWTGTGTTNTGNNNTNVFSPTGNTLSRGTNMNRARWYSSSTVLMNGEVYVQGGSSGQDRPEVRQLDGTFRLLSATDTSALSALFPRNFLAPDGRVFGYDTNGNMYYVNPTGTGQISRVGAFNSSYAGWTSGAAMFRPGKILQMGGNSNGAVVIDINGPQPVVTPTSTMSSKRMWVSATTLADGRVVATGGSGVENQLNDVNNSAEIWDPATGQWTVGLSGLRARLYHSSALLLPDATVLVTGGGAPGPLVNLHSEIYYPPYLYDAAGNFAPRPTITSAPDALDVGQSFSMTVGSGSISRVTLVKTGSVTHSVNMDQRFVELPFSASSGTLFVQMPVRASDTPPGYYMLFVIDDQGVPSQARIVRMNIAANPVIQLDYTSTVGGAGGAPFTLSCNADETLVGVYGNSAGTYVNRVGATCVAVDQAGRWIGAPVQRGFTGQVTGAAYTRSCPRDFAISGFRGRSAQYVDQLDFECKALTSNGRVTGAAQYLGPVGGTGGTPQGPFSCSTGNPGYALTGRSGGWIDSFGVLCRQAPITNTRTNTAPLLTNPGNQVGSVGLSVTLNVSALDPDGDTLSYGATGLPAGLAIAPGTGVVSGIPTAAGTNAVSLTVSDGTATTTASLTWTIAVPDPLELDPMPKAPPALVNTPVSYQATTRNGIGTQYRWQFGDGSETVWSSSPSVEHRFAQPGMYWVTVMARDDRGTELTRNFSQTVHLPLTANRSASSSSLALGSGRLWVVNADNDTVSVFNATNNQKLAEVPVGTAPRAVALSPAGDAWVTNQRASTVSVIDGTTLQVSRTIALPYGAQPYGLVFAANGSVYLALEGRGRVLRLDPATGVELASVDTGPHTRHLAINADGTRLYVSRFITSPLPGEHTASVSTTLDGAHVGGEVIVLDATSFGALGTIVLRHDDDPDFENSGSGVPNYLGSAVLSPDGTSAWVPSKKDNVRRGTLRSGGNLNHQNTVRAIASRIDLATNTESLGARVDLDNASMASAAAFDPNGVLLFVALETSREVAVVDAHNGGEMFRFGVGRAPQGLAISPDGRRLYVSNFMDRSVSVHDTSKLVEEGQSQAPLVTTLQSVAVEKLDTTVLKGKQFFYDARDARLAREGYMSCASCHNDGGSDGRTWDLTGMGEGLRNTIALRGHAGMAQGFLHWSGNFDEVQDFEGQIRQLSRGTGLMADADFNAGTRSQPLGDSKAGLSSDLDALAAYVASLNVFDASPFRGVDGSLTAEGVAGRAVFAALNCQQCHGGDNFSASGTPSLIDVGTARQPTSGTRLGGAALTGVDPPTLRGLWATAPYLHDGSATTLQAAVRAHAGVTISDTDLASMVAYLKQIDASEPAPTVPTPNRPPVVSSPGAQAGALGTAITLQVVANDPDGDPLTYAASGLPPGLAIGTANGVISGTPTTAGSFDVNVQASDAETSGAASFAWVISDAGAPTITITTPTAAATHAAGSSPLALGGTATDNVAVTQVSWSNDRGGSGTATGTTAWSASGIVLQSGQNVLTMTARDAAGNTGTDVLTVTYTPPDTTAPAVAITTPTIASSFATGATPLSLSGTASDAVGVTQVSWSNDRGGSGTASGTTGWSVSGVVLAAGVNLLTVTARDASGNTSSVTLSVTYTPPQALCSACTMFDPAAVPGAVTILDSNSVNLGVKFRAGIDGYVTGVRFYKGAQNQGTHVGSLWSSTGTLLASATFSNETASGWQQVNFSTPVPIQANAVYVASYLAPQGRYSGDSNYFASSAATRGVLQALQEGTSGGNGVYRYGASNAFPNSSWRSTNYWVDVVFSSDGTPPPDATAPSLTITTPTSSAVFATSTTPLNLGGTAADDTGVTQVSWSNDRGGSGTASGTTNWSVSGIVLATGANVLTVTARDAAGNSSSDTLNVTYSVPTADTAAPTVSISTPTSATTFSTSTASISLGGSAADAVGVTQVSWSNDRGGSGTASGTTTWTANNVALQAGVNQLTVTARDAAGNTATDVLSVTYDAGAPCSGCSLFSAAAIPTLASSPDTGAVNLGVKFRADVGGRVTGVRFYKGPGNTGTHVGSLWSAAGALLATATFGNETATGWQQVNFASPVTISANTTYVVSYHAPNGGYSFNPAYFASSGIDNGVLHAPTSGGAGGNGVYRYAAGNAFPDASYDASNYWVDVVFDSTPATPDTTAPVVTIATPSSASTFETSTSPLALGGTATDVGGVTQVSWSNDRGGSGTATGTGAWTANGIVLVSGVNTLTVTARDAAGNTSTDTLLVTYTPPVVDATPPVVTITTPTSGPAFTTSASPFTLAGTAADAVGVVQVAWSNDRGGSGTASGTANWSAGGIALASGVNVITVTARDAAGNASSDTLNVTYEGTAACVACSLWDATVTPSVAASTDTNAVNVGVKFRAIAPGRITGARFFKGAGNTGTHVASLWTVDGTLLAQATFTNETASGWQQVSFATPITIQPNTTYVVSYHAPNGRYAFDGAYFASTSVESGPLQAPTTAAVGGNGVYRYGAGSAFPNTSYNASNYWVDVVFASD